MPVVEVSCPNCGARLKAPDNMAGKKAKCKKCGKGFRIPGPAPASESAGDGQALSAMTMPTPQLPDDDLTEVMMAEPLPESIPAAPAPPAPLPPTLAKDLSALPSADPFDFGKSAKPAPPTAPAPAAPAAKPAFGAAKAAPPAAPKPAPPAPAPPAAPAAPKAKSGTVPQPAPKPAPLPLDDIPFDGPAKAKDKEKAKPAKATEPAPAAAPASDNPFAFSDAPADEKPAKKRRDEGEDADRPRKKRRDDDDDGDDRGSKGKRRDDDDDRPRKKRRDEEEDEDRSKKKRRDEDEDDDRPRKKKRDGDEDDDRPSKSKRRDDDEDEDKPRKKRDDEDDEKPAKGKGKEKGKGDPEFTFGGAPAEEPAAEESAPAGNNPFSFSALVDAPDEKPAKKRRDDDDEDDRGSKNKRRDDEDDDRPRKKRRDDDDEGEPEKPRYLRPDEKGGSGKTILITAGIGVLALGLLIATVIVYKNNNKPPEPEKKEEKKEDPPAPPGPAPGPPNPPPVDPKKPKDPDPKVPKDPDPKKPKDPDPKVPKDPDPKKPKDPEPVNTRRNVTLDKLRTFTVGAPPAKPVRTDDRKNDPPVLDVPLASVRRLFPPADPKTGDTFVLVQTAPAAGGRNERLALDTYGPAGNRIPGARIDLDGDGSANPVADMHSTVTGTYFLAAPGGKLHVWSLGENKGKLADGVNPYADKPDHAKAGLAAAFFAPDPTQVVTVSTAGAVLLFDLRTKKAVAEFVPPDGVPGKVALGQSVAKADNNASIVVAVAGVIYQIQPKSDLEVVRTYDLGGNVGRSLGLAAGGTPGRLLYVFETVPDKTGKKDLAVMAVPLGANAKHVFFQFPSAAVGEPKGAFWANGDTAGVATDRGVVWFYDHPDENKFQPLVFAAPPTGAGLYFGDEKHFWYVIPHTTMPTKSVVVAVSADFNDRSEYWKNFPGQLRTVRIDSTGLSK